MVGERDRDRLQVEALNKFLSLHRKHTQSHPSPNLETVVSTLPKSLRIPKFSNARGRAQDPHSTPTSAGLAGEVSSAHGERWTNYAYGYGTRPTDDEDVTVFSLA